MIAPLSLNDFASACEGQLFATENGQDIRLTGLAIDSRSVKAGDLFVAMKGARTDGHEFLERARAAGAGAALVQRPIEIDLPVVIARDTEAALASFGRLARDQYHGVVVGITGSAGKTSTKNLLAAILRRAGQVLATEGNRNNELGVPLTLSALDAATEFVVLEMGAGKPGDIAWLQAIARPTVGVLLNVAGAHLGNFGSLDAIAETKSAIFSNLPASGLAVFEHDAHWAPAWRELAQPARVLTFGASEQADYYPHNIIFQGFSGSQFTLETPEQSLSIKVSLPGRAGVMNTVAAATVAHALGVSPSAIVQGLADVSPAPGRGSVHGLANQVSLIDDSYNANPEAVRAAIELLASHPGRRYLVLGGMLELGADSDDLHAAVGRYARECGIDELWTVGERAGGAGQDFGSGHRHFADLNSAMACSDGFEASSAVLVKASRGEALDVLVAHWLESRSC